VHVLDEDDERSPRGELGQELDPGSVEAIAGRERMQVAHDVEPEGEAQDLARAEATTHLLGRVALEDLEVLLQDLGERPERDSVAVGKTASGQAQRARFFAAEPFPQLPHQSRLADAGVAEDGDQDRLRALDRVLIRLPEALELAVASDKRAREPAHAACAHERERAHERPAAYAARLPLRLDRAPLAELERAARR
jgi:hypothetical protein